MTSKTWTIVLAVCLAVGVNLFGQAGVGLAGSFNQPGNILIADQYNNRVIEIDLSGAIVWSFGDGSSTAGPTSIVAPNDAQRVGVLTLISATGAPAGAEPGCDTGCPDNRVLLVNQWGQIVWQYGQAGVTGAGPDELNAPVCAVFLPDSHILITDQGNQRVIEVEQVGKTIVWQYGMTGISGDGPNQLNDPNSAEKLMGGNVLIADEANNRVIEVDPNGDIVWHYGDPSDTNILNGPAFASRLESGDTLISDAGNNRIIEVGDTGSLIFEYVTNTRSGSVADPNPTRAVRMAGGNTLISDQNNHQVIEIDPAKTIVFSYGTIGVSGNGANQLNGPYDAKVIGDYTGLTPPFRKNEKFNTSGNILIADQFNNRVIEVTPDTNEIVWHFGDLMSAPGPRSVVAPNDAERIGELTLITGSGAPAGAEPDCPTGCPDNRVLLVDRWGQIVWQYGQDGVAGTGPDQLDTPVAAAYLINGNILITDQANQRVIEVTQGTKEIVWQYGTTGVSGYGPNQLSDPNSAELLNNGNILIADESNNRVIEVNRAGDLIWHCGEATGTSMFSATAFASRLRNGNTLVSDSGNNRVVEIDEECTIVWEFDTNTRPGSVAGSSPTRGVRLLDGKTLISDENNHQVIEVDQAGNIVWTYGEIAVSGVGPDQLNAVYDAKVIDDYTGLTLPVFGVQIEMPTMISPAEAFYVTGYLANPGDPLTGVPVFFILDVYGEYWFWNDWTHFTPPNQGDIDYQLMTIPYGNTRVEVIPAFPWPNTGADTVAGLQFWGAMLDADLSGILGIYDLAVWGYGPAAAL